MQNIKRMRLLGLTLLAAGMAVPAVAQLSKPIIIEFDAPGAAGTTPYSISSTGAITGFYWDASGVNHGFVRAPDGAITNFDYPGATFTQAWAIGPSGEITGLYGDPTVANWVHGFLRTRDGKFQTFDAPGAGNGTGCCGSIPYLGQGTMGEAINQAGWIAGNYVDSNNIMHGFLRAPDGRITEFAVPGANGYYGAWVDGAAGINWAGAISGTYIEEPDYVGYGYVREPDGAITVFSVPGAGTGAGQGTETSCINSEGVIVGYYIDPSGVNHGFLRAPRGQIATFDYPGAATGAGQGTVAYNINPRGQIVGYYLDVNSVAHGFVRSVNGSYTSFDPPDAVAGTYPATNNPEGAVTGFYVDASGVYHGFLLLP